MATLIVRQGHDGCCKGNNRDGIEVGEVGEKKMDRGEDQDEVGELDLLAVRAQGLVCLLQGFAPGDHVDDARADLDHHLLRNHDVQSEFLPKCVLA